MTAAVKSPRSVRQLTPRSSSLRSVSRQPLTSVPVSSVSPANLSRKPIVRGVEAKSQAVRVLPHAQTPSWLRSLVRLERGASVVTLVLGAAALTVYGSTVYSQQQWSRNYSRLQSYQRYERQLTVAAESLKNQMAQQAEDPQTGLIPQNPANTVFLVPAPQRALPAVAPVPDVPTEPETATPLGY